ncbi:MAG: hypothetical protein C4325_08100, partial [Blastocatellia bacterium]
MPLPTFKIKLHYLVIFTLLLIGLVPLLLTGWLLSGRSGRELRAVENRYQIQLVQEKARQIEMFAQHYADMVVSVASAIELANNPQVLNSTATERRLREMLRTDPNIIALYLKPVNGESLSIFRGEAFGSGELESIVTDATAKLTTQELLIGQPIKLSVGGDYAVTMASMVTIDDRPAATVIAVVSLKEIAKNIVGMTPTAEDQLWQAGLPIIFVVDQNGTAFFHPDPTLVDAKKPLTSLKIVEEWRQANSQIQSGLVPFLADYK